MAASRPASNAHAISKEALPCLNPDALTLAPRCCDRLYLGVLEDRLGVSEGGLPDKVSESALLDSFKVSLKQRSREMPCFGAGVMSSEDWWAEVVRATFRGAGVSDATLGIEEGGSGGGGVFDDVFDRLFHDVFTSTTAWELVPVRFCPPPPRPRLQSMGLARACRAFVEMVGRVTFGVSTRNEAGCNACFARYLPQSRSHPCRDVPSTSIITHGGI